MVKFPNKYHILILINVHNCHYSKKLNLVGEKEFNIKL